MEPKSKLANTTIVVFDLDGVITDESPYWESARATVRGVAGLREPDSDLIGAEDPYSLSDQAISFLKNRAINSNWDVAFVMLCGLLYAGSPERAMTILRRLQDGCEIAPGDRAVAIGKDVEAGFWERLSQAPVVGSELLRFAGDLAAAKLSPLFQSYSILGQEFYGRVHACCQEVHEQRMKNGTARHVPAVPLDQLVEIVFRIREELGPSLGVATGRTRLEAVAALEQFGILKLFDPKRIITHDEVLAAEEGLAGLGDHRRLGKPHPFVLLKAIYPEIDLVSLLRRVGSDNADTVLVGDTTSDVMAAKAAKAGSVGVVGAIRDPRARSERQRRLLEEGVDFVVESLEEIPEVLRRRG
jgi:phosphoglycolate phosphatase-like HAD superfamily hydrolase